MPDRPEQLATPPSGPSLDLLVQKARAHYPDIALSPERFAAFLAARVPSAVEQSAELDTLHIEDLYLACAYGMGIPTAQERVEAEHLSRIGRRLSRMAVPQLAIADILQELRCRLVELHDPDAGGRGYSGRGSLGGWLFVAAVRTAERRLVRTRQELIEHEATLGARDRLARAIDPEMEHQLQSCKETFESAMREGLAALSSRERNLLRYHFLEHFSIDRLAEIYGVHRATAARWIARAQKHLADETHARFAAKIPLAADSMPRLLELIRSKLDLNLSGVLQRMAEPES